MKIRWQDYNLWGGRVFYFYANNLSCSYVPQINFQLVVSAAPFLPQKQNLAPSS